MHLLTVTQYAKREGISQQAVYQRIKRGTLKTVYQKVEVLRIPVDEPNASDVK